MYLYHSQISASVFSPFDTTRNNTHMRGAFSNHPFVKSFPLDNEIKNECDQI